MFRGWWASAVSWWKGLSLWHPDRLSKGCGRYRKMRSFSRELLKSGMILLKRWWKLIPYIYGTLDSCLKLRNLQDDVPFILIKDPRPSQWTASETQETTCSAHRPVTYMVSISNLWGSELNLLPIPSPWGGKRSPHSISYTLTEMKQISSTQFFECH